MTEREFVLKYFCAQLDAQLSINTINAIKELYKTICENTSDENDDSFWLDGYERISFKDITKVTYISHEILEVKCIGMFHQFFGEDGIKFKQWFERKRGGK